MAARDRYEIDIKCPKCDQSGCLNVSENDYPFMKKRGLLVDNITGDFQTSVDYNSKILVLCKKCKSKFIIE